MSTKTTLFAAICACLIPTFVACGGVDDETIREDAVQIDTNELAADELVADAKHDERAPDDAVDGTSCQDAPQGLALKLETANNLNGCCFKCTATGQLQYKVFGGEHCQIVANNRCQTWGKGTGFDAHQCTWQ